MNATYSAFYRSRKCVTGRSSRIRIQFQIRVKIILMTQVQQINHQKYLMCYQYCEHYDCSAVFFMSNQNEFLID